MQYLLTAGTLANFNVEASDMLFDLGFDTAVKHALTQAKIAHADETSINVNGSKIWLHDFPMNNLLILLHMQNVV